MSDVKIAYSDSSYASISLSDAINADFSANFQDRSFETVIIQTSKNDYFKLHKLDEKLARIVTFEWKNLNEGCMVFNYLMGYSLHENIVL